MKRDETTLSILLNYECRYNHLILGHYHLDLSVHLYREFEDYKKLSYPFIIKEGIKGKGTKFLLRRPDLGVIMFYEVLEMMITDYYSRFKYRIYKTIPETFNYTHLVEIRYINEFKSDLRSSIVFDNKIILSEKEFQDVIKFKIRLYRAMELSLKNFIVRKLSIIHTVINSNIELIWDILRNMKLIHKYIHLLGNKIDYNGELIKKGEMIEIIKYKDKSIFKLFAKVNRCKLSKMILTKESIIELLCKKDKEYNNFGLTKIILRIYEFKGKCSMYILFYFLNIQTYESINNFTKMKKNELNKFKNMVENYKKSSNLIPDLKNK